MTTLPRPPAPWRLAPLLALLLAAGCTAPSPFGAPVEDRTRAPAASRTRPLPPPAPGVEVMPLDAPAPLTPTEPLVGQPLPAAPAAPATPPPPRPAPAPAPVASAPAAPSAPAEPEAERGGNNAVVALIDSANTYVRNNELDKAAASLERAQRLEPRNPNILYDLAQVRAHQAQYGQSEALAQKSIALAGGNKALQAKAWRLIAAVRRAGGNAAGGDAAEAQAVTLGGR
ncbi:MAG: hypothetical protein JSR94_14440 [Proteobacteria bacterium]|nr:hypothetical protein [Pseudomonadota bacterium]HNF65068.1 hypothetical protein [Plasticicumulans sp.]